MTDTNLIASIRTLSDLVRLMDDVQQAIALLSACIRDAQADEFNSDTVSETDSVSELSVAPGTVVAECLAEVEKARMKYLLVGTDFTMPTSDL